MGFKLFSHSIIRFGQTASKMFERMTHHFVLSQTQWNRPNSTIVPLNYSHKPLILQVKHDASP